MISASICQTVLSDHTEIEYRETRNQNSLRQAAYPGDGPLGLTLLPLPRTMPRTETVSGENVFPTSATSESVPVLTGHRSTPGLVTSISGMNTSASGASSVPSRFRGSLNLLRYCVIHNRQAVDCLERRTNGRFSNHYGNNDGRGYYNRRNYDGRSGSDYYYPPPPVTPPNGPPVSAFRPKTTNRGVQSRLDPSPALSWCSR